MAITNVVTQRDAFMRFASNVAEPSRTAARPAPSLTYDWLMTIASLWLSGGIMIDAWYHFHSTVETFFEPAHALLYAGLLASYVFTAVAIAAGYRQGYRWRCALPAGYEATLIGLIVCLAGGVSDMVKHSLSGFEEGFNGLLSPTHLLIGVGHLTDRRGPDPIGARTTRTPPNVARSTSAATVGSVDARAAALGHAIRLFERGRKRLRTYFSSQHAARDPDAAHAAIR